MGAHILARFVFLFLAISFVVKLGGTTYSPDHCVDSVISCLEDEGCNKCAMSTPDDPAGFATCHTAGQALGTGENVCNTTFLIPCCRDLTIELDCFSNTRWLAYSQCVYSRELNTHHCTLSSESCDIIWSSYDDAVLMEAWYNETASPTAAPTQSEKDQAITAHNSAAGAASLSGPVHDFSLALSIAVVAREVVYAWRLE